MLKPLIYNSDIKQIEKKAKIGSISIDEAALLRQAKWSELTIQQACKNMFRGRFGSKAKFIQTDNSRATKFQRMRAGLGGYEEGATDAYLVGKNTVFFVEFKKIGSPSEIEPRPAQIEMNKFLLDCGHKAFFCNNTVYFEKVICEEFAKSILDK